MTTTAEIEAQDVRIGDLIDLEGDRFADKGNNIFAFELARVEDWERETNDCLRIDFDSTSVGFPPDHKLKRVDA